jgi:hypothetical protein
MSLTRRTRPDAVNPSTNVEHRSTVELLENKKLTVFIDSLIRGPSLDKNFKAYESKPLGVLIKQLSI